MYGKCKRKPPWEFPQSCPACPGQHRRAASGRHQSPRKWRKQLLVVETVEVAELGKKLGRLILFILLFLTRLTRPVDFFVTNMVSWQILKGLASLSWTIGDHWWPCWTIWDRLPVTCHGPWPIPTASGRTEELSLATCRPKLQELRKPLDAQNTWVTWQHMATYGN